jgi:exonuclease III
LRLITWNVARRTTRLAEQAQALAARSPDVVALQEVTRRTEPLWTRAFELLGLSHMRSGFTGSSGSLGRPPAMWVMLASRTPVGDPVVRLEVPRPESAVGARVESELGPVEIHCVHVPNAANGWVKPTTLAAIRAGLDVAGGGPCVLCGDLNTPRRELPSGETISFARDTHGRLRSDRGEEWDRAELGVVPGLRELGFSDAFRSLHGYESREPSWTWKRIAGHGGGWRLDHIFASAPLHPVACRYHHEWREQDLSDHSALEADLA